MQLESIYQEIILDHYRRPHGKGLREPYDAEVYHVNPTCGDEVTLRVRLADGRVADVSYDSEGCSISQAAASVMSDLVVGQPLATALARHTAFVELMQSRGAGEPDENVLEDAVAFAGVAKYPARVKCALLPWMAVKDAIAQAVTEPPGRAAGAHEPPGRAAGAHEPPGRAAGAHEPPGQPAGGGVGGRSA